MAERVFNALHGLEIATLILRELEGQLALDDRFDRAVQVAQAALTFTLRLDEAVQPVVFTINITQTYKAPAGQGLPIGKIRENILRDIKNNLDRDERFSQHLTYPKVTWRHRLLVTLDVLNGDGRERELTVGESPEPRRSVDPSRHIDLTGRSEAKTPVGVLGLDMGNGPDRTVQIVTDEHGNKFRMVPVEPPNPAVQLEEVRLHPSSPLAEVVRPRLIDNVTGTGLPIDAGFKPSPGPAFADSRPGSVMGAIAGTVRETVETGTQHPDIEDGGVGVPDAVRRDAGMAIPGAQSGRAHGGIVDLPAGSF